MLLIFDLDQVLVDLAASTREAAARAAGSYLQEICLIPRGESLVSVQLTNALKEVGGFTHNHDLSTAALYYLLASVPSFMRPRAHKAKRIRDIQSAFRKKPIPFHALLGHSERSLSWIVKGIAENGGGLKGLFKSYPDGVVSELILTDGEIGATEREEHDNIPDAPAWDHNASLPTTITREHAVLRLYQEHYLGDDRFTQRYNIPPLRSRGDGLQSLEVLRSDLDTLRALAQMGLCTLVVDETDDVVSDLLRRLQIEDLFPFRVQRSDIPPMPPQPFAELQNIEEDRAAWRVSRIIETSVQHYRRSFDPSTAFYISPHRTTMAGCTKLNMNGVGFTLQREERKPLKEAGAKTVISKLPTLLRALQKRAARLADQDNA